VLALEERGHRLFGSWTEEGLGAHTVGPLPFGHVTDVADPATPGRTSSTRCSTGAPSGTPTRCASGCPDVPFVWHFKEAPQACVRSGTWPLLVDLVTGADRVVLATDEERDWFDLALPGRLDPERTSVLDGDLPKADWFAGERSPRLSDADGEVHTVCVGRPLGIDAAVLVRLGRAGIHVHLHGQVVDHGPSAGWKQQVEAAQAQVPGYVHLHPKVEQPTGCGCSAATTRLAAPLHLVQRRRPAPGRLGRPERPCRIPTYACAGLPMLQSRSPGCTVAAERLLGPAGVLYDDVDDLVARLHDRAALTAARRPAGPAGTASPSTRTPTSWCGCCSRRAGRRARCASAWSSPMRTGTSRPATPTPGRRRCASRGRGRPGGRRPGGLARRRPAAVRPGRPARAGRGGGRLRTDAAGRLGARRIGRRLLNPLPALLASSDKLATAAVWAAAGLPQPATLDLAGVTSWPAPGRPMVLKPAFCDGARYIDLVHDLEQARRPRPTGAPTRPRR
jgi:hypothetical protein